MKNIRALLIGIETYANAGNNLPGVSNDVSAFMRILAQFGVADVEVLRDANATSQNIRTALHRLVSDAREGDVRIFYYSGHGALLPPGWAQSDDEDGRDEAMVPYEGTTDSLILDNWFAQFLREKLPEETMLYSILDCCHSGELYKLAQIEGLPSDAKGARKEIDFATLEFTGNPLFMGRRVGSPVSTKALILNDGLRNSIQIAASEPGTTALVLSIDGQRRSVFTWALEQVIVPEMKIADLESLLTKKQAEKTLHHRPQVSSSGTNRGRPVFS